MGLHYKWAKLYSSPVMSVGEVISHQGKSYMHLKAKNVINVNAPVHLSQAAGVMYGVACTAAAQMVGPKAGAAMIATVTSNYFFAQCWGPLTQAIGTTGNLGTLTNGVGYNDDGGNQTWGGAYHTAGTYTASLADMPVKIGEVMVVQATAAASCTMFLTVAGGGKT